MLVYYDRIYYISLSSYLRVMDSKVSSQTPKLVYIRKNSMISIEPHVKIYF